MAKQKLVIIGMKHISKYQKNKKYFLEYGKKYRLKHKDRYKQHSKKYRSIHYKNNYHRNRSLIYRYNVDLNYFNNLLKLQKSKCGICNIKLIKPQLDHCHITKKVRGILCFNCNMKLGIYENWVIKNNKNIKEYLNGRK
jgi:hypothetical protein